MMLMWLQTGYLGSVSFQIQVRDSFIYRIHKQNIFWSTSFDRYTHTVYMFSNSNTCSRQSSYFVINFKHILTYITFLMVFIRNITSWLKIINPHCSSSFSIMMHMLKHLDKLELYINRRCKTTNHVCQALAHIHSKGPVDECFHLEVEALVHELYSYYLLWHIIHMYETLQILETLQNYIFYY